MKGKALLAVLCLGLAQGSYGFSLKDALKETARAIAEDASRSQPAGSSGGDAGQAVGSTTSSKPPTSNVYAASPDDELMKQGMWRDARTGLVWFRCHAGQIWSGAACTGGRLFETVDQAMLGASQLGVGGQTDWRLPTLDEVETIRHCDNKRGFVTEYGHSDYQAQDGSTKRSFGICKEGEPEIGTEVIFPEVGYSYWMLGSLPGQGVLMKQNAVMYIGRDASPARAMAVRGGQPIASYAQRLAEVKAKNGQKVAAESAAINAKQQKAVEYERKTKELRSGVKPGDRTAQGLVLAVNGDLVKVQTYGKQCASWTAVLNPYTGKPDCRRYETVVSGEQWVKRDELRPVTP